MLGRLAHLLVTALEVRINNKLLPPLKLVVIVPDDNMINLICKEADPDSFHGISKAFTRLSNYVMTEYECTISAFKEYLDFKSKKPFTPQFIWIQPPIHDNFQNNTLCKLFSKALEDTAKLHANTMALMLKKIWDQHNLTLFTYETQHFTSDGYAAYGEAIDRMVRFFDSIMLKKIMAPRKITHCNAMSKPQNEGNTEFSQNGKFQWRNPKLHFNDGRCPTIRLPTPPPL